MVAVPQLQFTGVRWGCERKQDREQQAATSNCQPKINPRETNTLERNKQVLRMQIMWDAIMLMLKLRFVKMMQGNLRWMLDYENDIYE